MGGVLYHMVGGVLYHIEGGVLYRIVGAGGVLGYFWHFHAV